MGSGSDDLWWRLRAGFKHRHFKPADIAGQRFNDWGWGIGWAPQPNPNGLTYHDHPVLFTCWRFSISDTNHCHDLGEVPSLENSSRVFRVEDVDQNYVWSFRLYESFDLYDSVTLNWLQGAQITNGERHAGADNGYAHFFALKRYKVGGTGWFEWGSLVCYSDTDTAFYQDITSNTEVFVRSGVGC